MIEKVVWFVRQWNLLLPPPFMYPTSIFTTSSQSTQVKRNGSSETSLLCTRLGAQHVYWELQFLYLWNGHKRSCKVWWGFNGIMPMKPYHSAWYNITFSTGVIDCFFLIKKNKYESKVKYESEFKPRSFWFLTALFSAYPWSNTGLYAYTVNRGGGGGKED